MVRCISREGGGCFHSCAMWAGLRLRLKWRDTSFTEICLLVFLTSRSLLNLPQTDEFCHIPSALSKRVPLRGINAGASEVSDRVRTGHIFLDERYAEQRFC